MPECVIKRDTYPVRPERATEIKSGKREPMGGMLRHRPRYPSEKKRKGAGGLKAEASKGGIPANLKPQKTTQKKTPTKKKQKKPNQQKNPQKNILGQRRHSLLPIINVFRHQEMRGVSLEE